MHTVFLGEWKMDFYNDIVVFVVLFFYCSTNNSWQLEVFFFCVYVVSFIYLFIYLLLLSTDLLFSRNYLSQSQGLIAEWWCSAQTASFICETRVVFPRVHCFSLMYTQFHLLFNCVGTESCEGLCSSSELDPLLPTMNNFVISWNFLRTQITSPVFW